MIKTELPCEICQQVDITAELVGAEVNGIFRHYQNPIRECPKCYGFSIGYTDQKPIRKAMKQALQRQSENGIPNLKKRSPAII